MAVAPTPIRIPTLTQSEPIVDAQQKPTNYFLRTLNGILKTLATAIQQLQQLPLIQNALAALDLATQAAQAAADAATGAAADSMAASAAAAREASLQASYISPVAVLTATPTTIAIATHDRIYPGASGGPATTVSVNGDTIASTAAGDVDYVYYIQPSRAGGSVSYQVSTSPPVQTGDTHVVGAVTIPATGSSNGGRGPQPPGYVRPDDA